MQGSIGVPTEYTWETKPAGFAGIPAEFDTFADLNTTGWTIPRIIVVDVDETNGNLRTTYFFDGVTTQWVPLVEI